MSLMISSFNDVRYRSMPRYEIRLTVELYKFYSINRRSYDMDWFLYDNGLRHERVKLEKNSLTKC